MNSASPSVSLRPSIAYWNQSPTLVEAAANTTLPPTMQDATVDQAGASALAHMMRRAFP